MRITLPLRILLATIVIFALPLLIYFLVVFYQSFQMRYNEVVLQLQHLGQNRALLLSQAENFSLRTLGVIEELIGGQGLSPPELDAMFKSVTKGGDFHSVILIEKKPDGQYIAMASSNVQVIGENFSGQQFIEQSLEGGPVTFLDFDETSFLRLLWVIKRIDNPPGLLVITTPVVNLLQRLKGTKEVPYDVNFSLVDTQNVVFASSNPNLALKTVEEQEKATTIEEGGVEYLVIRVPIPGTPLSLLVDVNQTEVLGHRFKRLFFVLGIFFVLVILGVLLALWITRRMSRPLRNLVGVMHQVSEGDLEARYVKEPFGAEINRLGAIFNKTIVSLVENMEKAESEQVKRETLAKELSIGREIQLSILPINPPTFPGVEIASRYLPAKEVGGDFYDAFVRGEDLVLTVADAAGKGISACLYSLSLRGMLRQAAVAYDDHATILREANNLFCQDTGKTGMFVTAFVSIYHPKTRILTYSAAGHPPSFLIRKSGAIERLESGGIPLGIEETTYVEGACTALQPGDLLLLYSDGVIETYDSEYNLYGEERLLQYLEKNRSQEPNQLIDDLLDELVEFRGPTPQSDDITLMALRIGE